MKNLRINFVVLLLVFSLINCQRQSEKDLYKTAMEDIKNGNFQSAIQNLEKIIEQNPNSEYAPEVYFSLASIYQSLEGDPIHQKANYERALYYYQELIDKFPNNEKAPEATFMAGFICAEYLQDYKRASIYYKKFLKAYPEHELAFSVQAELDNLGKSPEEILREKGVEVQAKGGSK